MKLPQSAIKTIETWRLGFVATSTIQGVPNLSPKGTFIVVDNETIAFGEMRSPNTINNLQKNPQLEVNAINTNRSRLLLVQRPTHHEQYLAGDLPVKTISFVDSNTTRL